MVVLKNSKGVGFSELQKGVSHSKGGLQTPHDVQKGCAQFSGWPTGIRLFEESRKGVPGFFAKHKDPHATCIRYMIEVTVHMFELIIYFSF